MPIAGKNTNLLTRMHRGANVMQGAGFSPCAEILVERLLDTDDRKTG